MISSLDALRISGVKAWWLDRLYTDWTGESESGGAEGWRAIVAKPEIRLLAFLVIGLGVGLIFRSREDSIILNIKVHEACVFPSYIRPRHQKHQFYKSQELSCMRPWRNTRQWILPLSYLHWKQSANSIDQIHLFYI
jgi:hypothetical protein